MCALLIVVQRALNALYEYSALIIIVGIIVLIIADMVGNAGLQDEFHRSKTRCEK